MKLTADYHTHTLYSDGANSIAENAARAKQLGLKEIAITEHGFSHIFFGIRRKEVPAYIEEIREAEEKEKLRVLVGIESNIRGISGLCDLRYEDYPNFDIYLAGIHVLIDYEKHADKKLGLGSLLRTKCRIKPSAALVKYTTQAYINAVKNNPIDVITHLNYLCFADAVEVAKCCRDYGTYLEISSKKPHLSDEELAAVADTGVRFVVNSDAHSIERIGESELAFKQIDRVGVPYDRIDNIDGKFPSFRFAAFKKERLS